MSPTEGQSLEPRLRLLESSVAHVQDDIYELRTTIQGSLDGKQEGIHAILRRVEGQSTANGTALEHITTQFRELKLEYVKVTGIATGVATAVTMLIKYLPALWKGMP